jgi:hypothetical protein
MAEESVAAALHGEAQGPKSSHALLGCLPLRCRRTDGRLLTDPGTALPCDRSLCIGEKSLQHVLALGDLSKNNGAGPCISAILTDELYQEDKSRIKVERKISIG